VVSSWVWFTAISFSLAFVLATFLHFEGCVVRMVSGWRRTFYTSNNTSDYENQHPTPKTTSTFSLFSTPPSIPHSESRPTLRCRTNSPLSRHQCNNAASTPKPSSRLFKVINQPKLCSTYALYSFSIFF